MQNLGRQGSDKITGFHGIAIGYVKYISGSNQYLLAPTAGDDNTFREAQWFDEQRINFGPGPVIELNNGNNPGFVDKPAPKR